MTYFEFNQALSGFDYYNKKTGRQIYRFELFLKGLTLPEVFQNYEKRERPPIVIVY